MTTFDPFDEPAPAPAPPPKLLDLKGNLKELDLDKELFEQYARSKNLFSLVEHAEEVPLNQKVQAMNSVISTLSQIVKLQADVYNAKTAADLEATLINVLKAYPAMKDAFLKDYRKALNA